MAEGGTRRSGTARAGGRAGAAAAQRGSARLDRRVKSLEIELQLYKELCGAGASNSEPRELLGRLLDFCLDAVEADAGTLYLLDDGAGELVFEVVRGPMASKLEGMRMRSDRGIAGAVAASGKPFMSEDLSSEDLWLGLRDGYAPRDILAVPLKAKRKVMGVVEVINKEGGRPYTKEDLRLLKSISSHFSLIMERTRLLAELDSRIEQLSILNEVGNLLVSTLDQKVVRERAMEAITRLMHAEAGSLLLIDNESGELFFEVALGEKGEQVKQVRLKIGEGIAGWVARYGRPVNIGDVTRDRRFLAEVDRQSNFRTRSILCVPVKIKNKIIGVLQAINRVGREAFTKDDQRLFQLFSNQVAIALDNARLYEEVKETFYATSQALADAIEMRDPYTGGHTRRVLEYSLAIGRRMGLDSSELEVLKLSAVLHDIGKIGIEDRVLRKPAPLDRHEAAEMRLHPGKGAEILRRVPQLKDVLPGTLHHHERYDGKGYPEGLKNGRIPLVARIIAVSDTYDAMTTTRPYRKGLDPAVAVAELKRCAGTQFDRKVVAAFIEAYENGEITGCGSGPAAGSGTRRERGGP